VLAPAGTSFDGLALWIAPSSLWTSAVQPGPAGLQRVEQARESLEHARTMLGPDGSFELAHLPPGPSRAFLVIAEAVAHGFGLAEDGVVGAERLDDFEVPAGGAIERDLMTSGLPGWLSFELRLDGQPAPFVQVRVLGPITVDGRTDEVGRFGPKRVPFGSWSVWAYDREAGWDGLLAEHLVVDPGEQADATLDAELISGTLTCVSADGLPIAGESISVVRAGDFHGRRSFPTSPVAYLKTDANGRLVLRLMSGEYALKRGADTPPWDLSAAVLFTWTATGPLAERVQL
jgi:hypothetical protein